MDGIYSPQNELQRQQQQQMMQAQNDAQNQINMQNQQMNAHRQAMANSMMAGPHGVQQPHGQGNNGSLNSLDDIIQNNQRELYRRRSMPQSYHTSHMAHQQQQQQQQQQQMQQPQSPRRMSFIGNNEMMTLGSGDDALGTYPFNQQMANGLQPLNTNMPMPDNMGNYMGDMGDYPNMSPDLMGSMIPNNFANMNMGSMGGMPGMGNDGNGNGAYSSSNGNSSINTPFGNSQINNMNQMNSMGNDFTMNSTPEDSTMQQSQNPNDDGNMIDEPSGEFMEQAMKNFHPQEAMQNGAGHNVRLNTNQNDQNQSQQQHSLSRQLSPSNSMVSPQHGNSTASNQQPSSSSDVTTPATGQSGGITTKTKEEKDKTIYSKSGFDMLKALWLVATRRNPKIHLGAVDMSCAFVVCDVTMNDCPIVYVSDNFQNLTGYSRHDIIGQNCRFLQAPDGKVEAGSKREFVDDGAVYNLKNMVHERREVQQSLINYRKGGKPFLNLLTMIPIPWDTDEIRYFIGFQIDLVECPDAISGQELGGVKVDYKHSDIGQYIWTPPQSSQWDPENGQTLGMDDVSTLLQQFQPKAAVSDWHKQSWDKMLLENTDDVVHVLSLKGLFLYASPACKQVLEYDASDLVGNSLSSVCHPSDIVPVTRELKDTTATNPVNIVFRIRRKHSGYTWFESHGSLFVEQGKGRKCIVLVGRKRPVFALSRRNLEQNGGIGDSELWTKLSTSGMFLFVSSNIRSLLDLQPESLVGTSIQELMRKDSKLDFGRAIEKARRGKTVTCKHEVQNRRGQVLQAQTVLYPGDAGEGQKPSFLLGQTKLLKASSRSIAPASATGSNKSGSKGMKRDEGQVSQPGGGGLPLGSQDAALASDDNMFDELRTTKCSSWQFELRQMEKVNRILAEELGGLLSNKKKRKRRKGVGNVARDCANCHTRNTPEWRRGPSGQRDLCNSCGLRWAKQTGRVSPRNSSRGGTGTGDGHGSKKSNSPISSSPLHKEMSTSETTNPLSLPHNSNGTPNHIPSTSPNHVSGAAASGAASATGTKPGAMMPPLSQPSIHHASQGNGMTSIREERENSQT